MREDTESGTDAAWVTAVAAASPPPPSSSILISKAPSWPMSSIHHWTFILYNSESIATHLFVLKCEDKYGLTRSQQGLGCRSCRAASGANMWSPGLAKLLQAWSSLHSVSLTTGWKLILAVMAHGQLFLFLWAGWGNYWVTVYISIQKKQVTIKTFGL